jgi:hypothetical protein
MRSKGYGPAAVGKLPILDSTRAGDTLSPPIAGHWDGMEVSRLRTALYISDMSMPTEGSSGWVTEISEATKHALRSFAKDELAYLALISSMPKARSRKAVPRGDRKSKTAGDSHNGIALTAHSALPPKKPPMPSVKRRWRRTKVRKLK